MRLTHPFARRGLRLSATSFVAGVLLTLSGCSLTPLARHSAAFSTATAIVINGSEDAYRAANRLYFDEQMSAAALSYDSQPNWDPHSIQPLLSETQLDVRTTLLNSLKAYAQNISEIENAPRRADGLDSAASGAGNNLMTLSSNLNGELGDAKGITVSQAQANGLSTAVKALGEFLIAKKVRRQLPGQIQAMDPQIEAICRVLLLDITALQTQTKNDYSDLLTQQDLFIRRAGDKLNPVERRAEIRKLPLILQKAEASKELLEALKVAIHRLALTHHALAAAAQGNNPEDLRAKIGDLQDAGQTLANFYRSLPTS
ncbi:hypothetical protein BH10ACI4_BH10ACI4_30250 [soil metagenome]